MSLSNMMEINSLIYGRPKKSYIEDFIAMNELAWENAPNVYNDEDSPDDRVQVEVEYGTKEFDYISARVDAVIEPATGKSVGDDIKAFIFKPDVPKFGIGSLFKWKKSYWLAVNTNNYSTMSNSCIVRKCNNRLKWIDNNGILRVEPCVMSYDIQQANDYDGKVLTTVGGFTRILCQRNKISDFVSINMRFLFGTENNRKAYKITAGGLRNYLNSETEDDSSSSVIEIWASNDYVNKDTDDIVNGIANAFVNQFTLNIEQSYIANVVGFSTILNANVKRDGVQVDVPVVWISSNSDVVEVDAEGNVTLVGLGDATITAYIGNNREVKDTIDISVLEDVVEESEILIVPDVQYVLEGHTQIFECQMYKNGKQQNQPFIFKDHSANNLSKNYVFSVIDESHFQVQNKKKSLGNPILIECSSEKESKIFDLELRGAY